MSGGVACLCAWVSGGVGCMQEGWGRFVWCGCIAGCIIGVVCSLFGPSLFSCSLYSTLNILLCSLLNIHLNYPSIIYYNSPLAFWLYSCSMGVRLECKLCVMYQVKMEVWNINKIKSAWVGGIVARGGRKSAENGRKWPPKKGSRGPPGRGVLRFSAQAYRNPVHIFAKNAVFSENLQI